MLQEDVVGLEGCIIIPTDVMPLRQRARVCTLPPPPQVTETSRYR